MGRIRGPTRTCPDCFELYKVSGSKCFCYNPSKSSKKSSNQDVKIRRTERVRRGRPDFFDVLEYDRQAKKERKPRAKSKTIPAKEPVKPKKPVKEEKFEEDEFKTNRMQLTAKKTKPNETDVEVKEVKEEELEEIVLSKETIAKFDLILQDINRKIYASSWRRYT